MKFNIQYLHAAVVMVLSSLQPQAKAAECKPLIVEKVTQMGARFNHKDVLKLQSRLTTSSDKSVTYGCSFQTLPVKIWKMPLLFLKPRRTTPFRWPL
ncbi:hypothetical protein MBP13_026885 [Klebsiella pneumoniae]